MAIRDPGNKPQSNDRIPYAYIEVEDEDSADDFLANSISNEGVNRFASKL
jgi:hypothetical protein